MHEIVHPENLCLFNEFFLTLGTGDGDLTFSSGHAHRLPATGAGEIAVIPILDPVQQH